MINLKEIKEELQKVQDMCSIMPFTKCQEYVSRLINIADELNCRDCITEICEREYAVSLVLAELNKYGENALLTVKNMLSGLQSSDAQYLYLEGDATFKDLTPDDLSILIDNILGFIKIKEADETNKIEPPAWESES